MPCIIKLSLESQWLWIISWCCLALLFFSLGLSKVFDVETGFQEMQAAGLEPAWLLNYASALILLVATYSILFDRHLWLGTGLLSIFLILTIMIVHTFWNMSGLQAQSSLYFALEHIAVIGGLISISIDSYFRKQLQDAGVIV